MPSTAQVCTAVVPVVVAQLGDQRGVAGRSAPRMARRSDDALAGVSVRSRLGHTGSQYPHVEHRSTSASTTGPA